MGSILNDLAGGVYAYYDWCIRSHNFWVNRLTDSDLEEMMNQNAQWQAIFTALWQSGLYKTQNEAGRKADEIVAARPSMNLGLGTSSPSREQRWMSTPPGLSTVNWNIGPVSSVGPEHHKPELAPPTKLTGELGVQKGVTIIKSEPEPTLIERIKGWFYVEETDTDESVEGTVEAADGEEQELSPLELSAASYDVLPTEEN